MTVVMSGWRSFARWLISSANCAVSCAFFRVVRESFVQNVLADFIPWSEPLPLPGLLEIIVKDRIPSLDPFLGAFGRSKVAFTESRPVSLDEGSTRLTAT